MPCELNPNSTQRPYGQTESSLVDELRSPNKIPQLESDHNPCSTSPAIPLSDQKQQNKSLLSPESTQGPSLRLEMSEKMQASLTSALFTIAAAPVAGYYTSRAAASGLTNIESEEEESKDGKQGLTLLPTNFTTFDASTTSMSTNFPTFDATSTSLLLSSLSSLQSLPSKPTAVVSPSRPRLPMPFLPKPVPAAISSSPVKVEKVPVLEPGYVCRQCPQGFPSREGLLSHQLTAHPWN